MRSNEEILCSPAETDSWGSLTWKIMLCWMERKPCRVLSLKHKTSTASTGSPLGKGEQWVRLALSQPAQKSTTSSRRTSSARLQKPRIIKSSLSWAWALMTESAHNGSQGVKRNSCAKTSQLRVEVAGMHPGRTHRRRMRLCVWGRPRSHLPFVGHQSEQIPQGPSRMLGESTRIINSHSHLEANNTHLSQNFDRNKCWIYRLHETSIPTSLQATKKNIRT